MASKFVEKHKRKSVLAALAFIFSGKVKYVSILLMVVILSVPFVISGETLSSMIELPGVAAFLKSVGLGSVVSSINPKYSNDIMKSALAKAMQDSEQNSFWNKFLRSINATMPPAGAPSTMDMIRGGKDDIFGPAVIKDDMAKRGPGQVKGAVNDEEKARGENGDDVNLEGMLAGGAGAGGGYGDSMGQNLAGNFANGGAMSGSAPYMDRTMLGGPGTAASGRGAGMYSQAMGSAGSKVPVPGTPQKINVKRMGRVSGFSWKNVGFKTANAKVDVKLSSKKPMFQLAQTFAMTGSAYKSKDSALEYQAAYTGTTYDGNDSNLDVIQTDAASPAVPDTAFTGDLMTDTQGLQDQAKACSDAQGSYGAQMSEDGKMMEDTGKSLGSPPKCCSSGVGAWNSKIDQIISYCNDYNVNEAQLSAKCQNKSSPMDCGSYHKMHINPCSKLMCWLMIILMILLAFLTFGLMAALAIGVLAAGSMLGGDMFGPIGGMVQGFISKLAGGE